MFRYHPSIQNKIKYGYYICLALIIIVSVLNYFNLKRIDRKISFSFVISELFDTTLEMRRFEKNYFLYRDKNALNENNFFTQKAEQILQKNRASIEKLSIRTDISALEADINDYSSLMQKYFELNKNYPSEAAIFEGKIREKGKNIVDATEAISIAERRYIQSLISSSKWILISSIVFLMVVGCIIGHYLSQLIVKPLKQLENSMQRIADGKFDACSVLSIDSSDREIISLSNACTRMIRELELRQMKVIAQSERLASLGTMVSGVAHQLNNPLSNISTSCQILQEEIEESDIKHKEKLLFQIEGQVERAKNMVNSLLEFSRKKEFKTVMLPLKGLIYDTLGLLKGDIPTKVEIEVNIPDDILIVADKQRMEQAFLNIIKNSIDAILDEGKVVVSAEEDIETNVIEIIVYDTGVGIEAEDLGKIFNPFFTTKIDGKGSGLGLFVAREIIKEHGGVITAESTAGAGTTFSLKIPSKGA